MQYTYYIWWYAVLDVKVIHNPEITLQSKTKTQDKYRYMYVDPFNNRQIKKAVGGSIVQ